MSKEDVAQLISNINARIDRLPAWGFSRLVLVIVGLSYFFAFYDIAAFGFSLNTLISSGILTLSQAAIPGATFLAGYIVGALIIGNIADRVGRKNGLLYTVAILSIGSLLTAFSWNVWSFSTFRFITGLGVGAELAISATIISELSSSKKRGRYVQYNYFWGAAGLGIAPFFIVALLSTPLTWRLVFGFGAIVAFLTLVIRSRYLPESPRWLAIHGKIDEAIKLVEEMEKTARKRIKAELPQVPEVPSEYMAAEKVPLTELFSKYPRRAIMIFCFWTVWYITVYAWLGYEPLLLSHIEVTIPHGLLFVALSDLAIPVAAIFAFVVTDFVHRKYLVAGIGFLFALSSFVVSIAHNPVTLFLGTFFGAFAIGANSVAYTYTAEMFPSRIRATATSFGDGAGHLGGVVAPFVALDSLAAFGARETFVILAIIVFASGIIALIGPKTTKIPLTEIAK